MTHPNDEPPAYRRYGDYEPAVNQQPGVYYSLVSADHPAGRSLVPRLFSVEFFRFFAAFLAAPEDNPVFMREWRRKRRALPWVHRHWVLLGIGTTTVVTLGCILLVVKMEELLPGANLRALFLLLFFLSSAVASVLGLLLGLRGCSLIWNKAASEEVRLTHLRPQEVVFGHLLGGVLPFTFPLLVLLPGVALWAFHVVLESRLLDDISPVGAGLMVLWLYPHVTSSVLASAAVGQSLSFGNGSAFHAILIWVLVSMLVVWPVTLYSILAWPYTFHIGAPVLVAVKLLIMGAFLHHMAVRMATSEADG